MLFLIFSFIPAPSDAQRPAVILSTTSSTQDSGLLDLLVPLFEKKTGYTAKTISVGTGQALALAARGEADVTLAHAPALEKKYVTEGKLLNRRLVMLNDFVIVGPRGDPAGVGGVSKAHEAMKRIAARCDETGTFLGGCFGRRRGRLRFGGSGFGVLQAVCGSLVLAT